MNLNETLDAAKVSVKEIMKNRRYKKANLERQEAVQLQADLMKCRGKLEVCKKEFNRTIVNQSKSIRDGQAEGHDTLIQQQMLWDAAIGYMLVRDAIFALKSISSHDSIAHAYDMLEEATKQMAGKGGKLPKFLRIKSSKERNTYGYVTSSAALKAKEDQLDTFFEALKETGDIEGCLTSVINPAAKEAELRKAYTSGNASAVASNSSAESDIDTLYHSYPGDETSQDTGADYMDNLDILRDIDVPE